MGNLRNECMITENVSIIFLVCINFNGKHKKNFNEIFIILTLMNLIYYKKLLCLHVLLIIININVLLLYI